jgi:hypothetical protein
VRCFKCKVNSCQDCLFEWYDKKGRRLYCQLESAKKYLQWDAATNSLLIMQCAMCKEGGHCARRQRLRKELFSFLPAREKRGRKLWR